MHCHYDIRCRYSHKILHVKRQRAKQHYMFQLPYRDIDCVGPTPPEARWYFQTTCEKHSHNVHEGGNIKPLSVYGCVQRGHLQMLRCIAVWAVLQFLPTAKVSCRAMKQVAVAGGQQLAHQHHKRVDPHHDKMLTWPAHVIVLGALWKTRDNKR